MPNPFAGLPIISTAVVASPALAVETTIAQVVVGAVGDATTSIDLSGWAAFTVGATGTAIRLRVRRGGIGGTIVADTGSLTGGVAAAGLLAQDTEGVDVPGEVASVAYVLTLQVVGATGASAVSAVKLRAVLFS